MITVMESGLPFGPFEENSVFLIERSTLYQEIGPCVRSVEFLLSYDRNSLLFLEAKSSSPKPSKESSIKFDAFIEEIAEKFLHSFDLYHAATLKRHKSICDLPPSFQEIDHAAVSFKFCLVINGHDKAWLPPISDALNRKLAAHAAIWNSCVVVLNEKMAEKYRLVCTTV